MELDKLFEAYNKAILYIAIREGNSKKHTPYNFRTGYTNLMGVTCFSLDKLDNLKKCIVESVDNAKSDLSMQIVNRQTKKVLFKYSNF